MADTETGSSQNEQIEELLSDLDGDLNAIISPLEDQFREDLLEIRGEDPDLQSIEADMAFGDDPEGSDSEDDSADDLMGSDQDQGPEPGGDAFSDLDDLMGGGEAGDAFSDLGGSDLEDSAEASDSDADFGDLTDLGDADSPGSEDDMSGGAEAGKSSALVYTLLANCKAEGIDPERYLAEAIRRLPANPPPAQAAALTPAKLAPTLRAESGSPPAPQAAAT